MCTTPRVYPFLLDVTTYDHNSQAFPLCVCILQAIKYWRWECPGNEAMYRLKVCYYKLGLMVPR